MQHFLCTWHPLYTDGLICDVIARKFVADGFYSLPQQYAHIIGRLQTPLRKAFSYGHHTTYFIDSRKHKVILHWITIKYAISSLKMSHVWESATSLLCFALAHAFKTPTTFDIDVWGGQWGVCLFKHIKHGKSFSLQSIQ